MKTVHLLVVASLLVAPAVASARDDRRSFSIANALRTPAAMSKLYPRVKLVFGSKTPAPIASTMGEAATSRKTNAFGKSEQEACDWVFLSAVLELQAQARRAGADAVVGIESNYKHERFDSATEYTCGIGSVIAGVAFRGTIAKLKAEAPRAEEPKPAEPK
jgi:uncharacterized protein YbjQ (UPF0145 family)